MVCSVLKALGSFILTLWAILTATFLLMEIVPGGPGASERPVEPLLEAANLARLGLVQLFEAPCSGIVRDVPSKGQDLLPGDGIVIEGEVPCILTFENRAKVYEVFVEANARVRAGQKMLATKPPLLTRYAKTLAAIATLDLGVSFGTKGERTVRELLAESLPVSFACGALALVFALFLGLPLGFLAVSRQGTWIDRMLSVVSTAQVSVPAIVLGPLLLYLFAIRFQVFSPGGLERPEDLVLPALTLGLIVSGTIQKMTKAGAQAFCESEAFLNLQARGLSPWRIYGLHVLRHTAIPMLGYLPPIVANLLTGSLVVEKIFNLPGVSRHLIGAALNRDYPVVMGVVLLYSLVLLTLTTLATLLHPILDPRLRRGPRLHKLQRARGWPV